MRVNIAVTRTILFYLKGYSISFLMIPRLMDFALVILLLLLKVHGIIRITKIVFFNFSGIQKVNISLWWRLFNSYFMSKICNTTKITYKFFHTKVLTQKKKCPQKPWMRSLVFVITIVLVLQLFHTEQKVIQH